MNDRSPRPSAPDADGDPLAIVETLYAPAPLDAARRHAFDRALEERIALERPARPLWLRPALAFAGAGALAAALWLALPGVEAGPQPYEPVAAASSPQPYEPVAAASSPATGWDYELFFPAELGGFEAADDTELPGPMQDIAAVFLDG